MRGKRQESVKVPEVVTAKGVKSGGLSQIHGLTSEGEVCDGVARVTVLFGVGQPGWERSLRWLVWCATVKSAARRAFWSAFGHSVAGDFDSVAWRVSRLIGRVRSGASWRPARVSCVAHSRIGHR